MNKDNQIKNAYTWMAYGDAIGFLYENTGDLDSFKEFSAEWDINNKLAHPLGQWSDLTQLMLLTTKSLLDEGGKLEVSIDYRRFQEELRFFQYYRNGNIRHLSKAIEDRKEFLQEDYVKDVRGYGISRVAALALANKNYNQIIGEACRNILYFNQNPQVILSGVLICRIFYLLLEKHKLTREDLLQQLKDYLIELDLKVYLKAANDSRFSIAFEREKINYIIDLDRLMKQDKIYTTNDSWGCKHMLLGGLINYWKILKGEGLATDILPNKDTKESLALAYGFAGITEEAPKELSKLENLSFIESMGEYTAKLRNYQVNKKAYVDSDNNIDIFKLVPKTVFKHDIFNVSRIMEKSQQAGYMHVLLENKTGKYFLIKKDSS